MGKASRRKRAGSSSSRQGSLLVRIQHALHRMGQATFDGKDPDLVTPENAGDFELIYRELIMPLSDLDSKGWVERVEKSLETDQAPPHARDGWRDVMHQTFTGGLVVDGKSWYPLSMIVSVDRDEVATLDAHDLLENMDNLADNLSQRWTGQLGRVLMGRQWSNDTPETLVAVHNKAIPGVLTDWDEAGVIENNRQNAQWQKDVALEMMGLTGIMEDFEDDLLDDDSDEGEDDLTLHPTRYHLGLYLLIQLDEREAFRDEENDRRRQDVLGQAIPLTVNRGDDELTLNATVEDLNTTVNIADRLSKLNTIRPFETFLNEHHERLGHSWEGVRAIMYPVYDDRAQQEGDPMEMEAIHVVLWATSLNTLVGQCSLNVITEEDVDGVTEVMFRLFERMTVHGLTDIDTPPPQPMAFCEDCGAPVTLTPDQNKPAGEAPYTLQHVHPGPALLQ